jgi:hypothetical protein
MLQLSYKMGNPEHATRNHREVMEKRKRFWKVERDKALFFRLNERLIAELNLTQLQNKKIQCTKKVKKLCVF